MVWEVFVCQDFINLEMGWLEIDCDQIKEFGVYLVLEEWVFENFVFIIGVSDQELIGMVIGIVIYLIFQKLLLMELFDEGVVCVLIKFLMESGLIDNF